LRYCRSRVFTFLFFMQKLSGISSGPNNKSCSIIHHESNKTGFAFFRFLYDFLRNLQVLGNPFYYWSSPFAVGTLERMLALQCGPRRGWPAQGGQIPASRRRAWPGKGVRRLRGSLGFGLWPQKGGGALVRGAPTALRQDGHGGLRPGGAPAWEEARWCREVGRDRGGLLGGLNRDHRR
jgi:hypothetical protein